MLWCGVVTLNGGVVAKNNIHSYKSEGDSSCKKQSVAIAQHRLERSLGKRRTKMAEDIAKNPKENKKGANNCAKKVLKSLPRCQAKEKVIYVDECEKKVIVQGRHI